MTQQLTAEQEAQNAQKVKQLSSLCEAYQQYLIEQINKLLNRHHASYYQEVGTAQIELSSIRDKATMHSKGIKHKVLSVDLCGQTGSLHLGTIGGSGQKKAQKITLTKLSASAKKQVAVLSLKFNTISEMKARLELNDNTTAENKLKTFSGKLTDKKAILKEAYASKGANILKAMFFLVTVPYSYLTKGTCNIFKSQGRLAIDQLEKEANTNTKAATAA